MSDVDGNAIVVEGISAAGSDVFLFTPQTGSGDSVDPQITNITPAPGTQLASRLTPITFNVTDNSSDGFSAVAVWVKYVNQADTFVIFDGSSFVGRYAASSSRTEIALGHSYSVLEYGGWSGNIERLFIMAVDATGNLEGTL